MNINFYSDNESLIGRDVLACALYSKLINAGYNVKRHLFPAMPIGGDVNEAVKCYGHWLELGKEFFESNSVKIIAQPIEWLGDNEGLKELKKIVKNDPEINFLVVSELCNEQYKNCECSRQEVLKIMNSKKVYVVFAKEGFIDQSVHTMYDIFLKEVLELEKKGIKGDMITRKQLKRMEELNNAGC